MSAASDKDLIALPGGRTVPLSATSERAVPSGGPGGQHANRASTKVELRIVIADLPLTDDEHALVQRQLGGRLTDAGELILTCDDERSQLRNRAIVRKRAERVLAEALQRPRRRRKTKPSRAAKRRAQDARKAHSDKKRSRRWKPRSDDV